ncbi:Hpt domain-containing protein [Vannielia litorea]|uniref:Hpt domain-containing protein n=1 Tax=Vannielia litorea TaxID=1217970 RepID=A0A1N6HJ10_9RHOB|nr:Hpt domain-containing protein [Vannielia litorea]SIO19723.1 Hpt domain-containing protein [Vannielia litorea]
MIDWDRVTRLRDDVGEDAFAEVKDMFVVETERVLSQFAAGGSGQWEEDFHSLKSSALNMGFEEVARLCQDAELRARTGAAGPADAAAVTASFKASMAAFEQGLAP